MVTINKNSPQNLWSLVRLEVDVFWERSILWRDEMFPFWTSQLVFCLPQNPDGVTAKVFISHQEALHRSQEPFSLLWVWRPKLIYENEVLVLGIKPCLAPKPQIWREKFLSSLTETLEENLWSSTREAVASLELIPELYILAQKLYCCCVVFKSLKSQTLLFPFKRNS